MKGRAIREYFNHQLEENNMNVQLSLQKITGPFYR